MNSDNNEIENGVVAVQSQQPGAAESPAQFNNNNH